MTLDTSLHREDEIYRGLPQDYLAKCYQQNPGDSQCRGPYLTRRSAAQQTRLHRDTAANTSGDDASCHQHRNRVNADSRQRQNQRPGRGDLACGAIRKT